MLLRPGELIKEGGLAAILVPHQGKCKKGPLGQRVAAPLWVEFPLLPHLLRNPVNKPAAMEDLLGAAKKARELGLPV